MRAETRRKTRGKKSWGREWTAREKLKEREREPESWSCSGEGVGGCKKKARKEKGKRTQEKRLQFLRRPERKRSSCGRDGEQRHHFWITSSFDPKLKVTFLLWNLFISCWVMIDC